MLQNDCQLQDDSEHIGKRSVDGSEAVSSQWEVESRAKMENLNSLSSDNSVHDHDSKNENISNICSYSEEKSNNLTQESSFKFLQTKRFSVNNFNQFQKLLKNLQTLKNPLANMSSYIEGSNASRNNITDPVVFDKCKINLKDNASKSLNNSPTETNVSEFDSKCTEKVETQSLVKYVPNKIFNFGFSHNKSRSNNDISLSLNLDTNSVGKYQSLDGILDDKTDNFESDKHIKPDSVFDKGLFEVKETYNNGLHTTKNLHCPQLNTHIGVDLQLQREVVSGKKWLRSNSLQFLSNNSNLSPVKLKHISSVPSESSLNKKLTNNLIEYYDTKGVTEITSNVRELPLLSFFEKTNLLANSKSKSYSMINLDDKRNFVLSNDVHLKNVKTKSADKLANSRDNLFLRVPR